MLAFEDAGRPVSNSAVEAGSVSARSSVIVVCSPRPRVGKTLVARLMVDFFLSEDRSVVAFDVNPYDPVLSEYLPTLTEPANVASTMGQMALFDRLIVNDGFPKVLDIASDQFDAFFDVMRETSFALEARRRSIDTVVLYVVDNHPRSATAYRRVLEDFPGLTLVPVYNDIIETYGAPGLPHPSPGAMPVHVPHLPPYLLGVIKRKGFSISDFVKRPSEFPTLLHKWIGEPFIAFRDLELRLSLADLVPLFRYRR